jgi:drug/metabolite transporter (DMT)-like permease
MIMHFEHMKVMSNDIFSRTKQFIKQLNPKQILGIALFVAGLYLLISSIYTIRQMCSDSDSSSGFLGIASFFNPLIGLASLADSDSAEFDITILTPLIGGIILTITGAVLVIIQSMKKRLHK